MEEINTYTNQEMEDWALDMLTEITSVDEDEKEFEHE